MKQTFSSAVGNVLALNNELTLDNEGWALLAPYGEHRKTRMVQRDGRVVTETFVQIFDEAAVDAILAHEKGDGLLARLKRALIKRPIYNGHPDLPLYAPETVSFEAERLIPLGVNEDCRKTARGLEFKPLLVPEGARVVEDSGCKYPSGLFLLTRTGRVRDNGDIEARPFKLASIGLTAFPNISGVDSLANASTGVPGANIETHKPNSNDTMKQLLIGWLAAQGVALSNDATDQSVFDAFHQAWLAKASSVTALGNDKTALTQTVTSLAAERDAEKLRAEEAALALANARKETAGLRGHFIAARVDLAITQGKAALAERAREITALENSSALEADLAQLDERPVKFPTLSNVEPGRKLQANATSASLALANAMEAHLKAGKTKGQALALVIKEQPALHASYVKEGGSIVL